MFNWEIVKGRSQGHHQLQTLVQFVKKCPSKRPTNFDELDYFQIFIALEHCTPFFIETQGAQTVNEDMRFRRDIIEVSMQVVYNRLFKFGFGLGCMQHYFAQRPRVNPRNLVHVASSSLRHTELS